MRLICNCICPIERKVLQTLHIAVLFRIGPEDKAIIAFSSLFFLFFFVSIYLLIRWRVHFKLVTFTFRLLFFYGLMDHICTSRI